jgi:hypothetical protein
MKSDKRPPFVMDSIRFRKIRPLPNGARPVQDRASRIHRISNTRRIDPA